MYKVTFQNGEIFIGGNPENSLWNQIPSNPIKKIEFDLYGKKIILEGYEAYNHQIKFGFLPFNSQKTIILAIIIMVLEKGNVGRIIFDFPSKRIIKDIVPFGKEYNNKPVSGWKTGLVNLKSEFKIS